MENNQTDKSWISVKKMGLPELEEISTTNFSSVYKSNEVYWFAYGTGGRKMKVISKVIAWMELPDKYEGE